MKWGHLPKDILALLERRFLQGKKCTPIEEKPSEIKEEFNYLLDSFWLLHRTRHYSESGFPLPISFQELNAFLEILDSVHDRQSFIDIILMLDQEYLAIIYKKIKEQQDKKK